MIWYMLGMSALWFVSAGAVTFTVRENKKTAVLFRQCLAENDVLQRQIRDALAWRQPHLCNLPRAEKCGPEGEWEFPVKALWTCPVCSLRWSVRGHDTLNGDTTRRIDWVTQYEAVSGHRPLYDARPRAALTAPQPAPASRHAAPAPAGPQ